MKLETYLAKVYDVAIVDEDDIQTAAPGQRHIEIYEKGKDCESIGRFVQLPDTPTLEYRNVYGIVQCGSTYSQTSLKAAVKRNLFY